MEGEGMVDRGGAALAASTTSAISAIQPDIELGRREGWYNSVEDSGKCWMCGNTQSLDHQTAIEWKIEHALYIEQMRKTLKHSLSTHDKLFVGAMYTMHSIEH